MAPLLAQAAAGATSYRVTIVLYPGDDPAAVARRLAAMYRGTLETPVDGNGPFTISLSEAGAGLMRRDPMVAEMDARSLTPSVPPTAVSGNAAVPAAPGMVQTNATTGWTLGPYRYDGSGNIRAIGSDFYAYDQLGRLVVSADAPPSTPAVPRQTYTYDPYGNLRSVNTAGRPAATFEMAGASNRLASVSNGSVSAPAAYDASGNFASYLGATYEYDALNVMRKSLTGGVTRSYVYTASDERIGTIEQAGSGIRSEWTIRDSAGQVLRRYSEESNGEWKWQEDYIYRGTQMLAAEIPDSAKTRHFHLDHLGTPRLITGNGGAELSRHIYHPFGEEIAPGAGAREKKQFTGHERDSESLDYMHARFYAPFMGRFLSVDPVLDVKAALVAPEMWNRYAYVRNNPINKVDPTGRYEEDVHHQLTYALSRAAGFSPAQAGAISGADQGVDDNPATSPFKSTEVRAAYHFTTPERRAQMWGAFEKTGSLTALGQFFHAQQDSYSHAGYGPKVGHAAAGHKPDKTYNDPAKALRMAFDTYSRLNQAADKLGIPRGDRAAWGQIKSAVVAFNLAKTEKDKDAAMQRLIGVIAARQ
jgi:RHS repeat-associated protein